MENSKEKKTYDTGMVNRSKVKSEIRGLNVSTEYLDMLEEKIKAVVEESVKRATANGRRTVLARDL
jgi:histone H3/H4